jgi:hypothetical protein
VRDDGFRNRWRDIGVSLHNPQVGFLNHLGGPVVNRRRDRSGSGRFFGDFRSESVGGGILDHLNLSIILMVQLIG